MTSLGEDALNGHGFVKIKPTMQLLNHPSIFALGDIIDWTEQKQAAKLMWHVPVIVGNVVSFLNGATPTKKYTGATEMIVITNGKVSKKAGELLWLDPDMVVIERRHGLLRVLRRVHPGRLVCLAGEVKRFHGSTLQEGSRLLIVIDLLDLGQLHTFCIAYRTSLMAFIINAF